VSRAALWRILPVSIALPRFLGRSGLRGLASGGLLLLAVATLPAQAPPAFAPEIAPASKEGEIAIQRFRIPAGLQVELFAAEPLLANPVAFCFDELGRCYVAETFRHHSGVTDARRHPEWLNEDLANRTVEERVAMYRKHLGDQFANWGVAEDRVRLLVDENQDGRADAATVFAGGFQNAAAGIGAGLLARRGDVYYTCIPDLWRLRDANHDGVAELRQSLQTGYGVHVGFLGHDLHGLKFGPDGKLYFTIGDRGLNVQKDGQSIYAPDTGSVLRCEPDGTQLEIFATGLRNPQEIAFDALGNLFTVDNNSDSGDQARVVYLVAGGDSGWRIGYQFHNVPGPRGPWNEEKLWKPRFEGQAAYLLPPLMNLSDGPSGLTINPGVTSLPERYKDTFFLADFRGASAQSGIRTFKVEPDGASFKVVQPEQFLWQTLVTDCDFAPDGALYFSDWVEGWEKPKKGRIYRVFDPKLKQSPAVVEVQKMLAAEGLADLSLDQWAARLSHADQRIRQSAQFSLAGHGAEALPILTRTARQAPELLARVHAIWALGQIGRKIPDAILPLREFLQDPTSEVRAQTAKILGELADRESAARLIELLNDAEPRVAFFAAQSLGKLQQPSAVPALLELLRTNNDRDVYLRHAAVLGLAGSGDVPTLLASVNDPAAPVRLGVLLALRRLERPEVAKFLVDADPYLVAEAARAINDVPIPAAFPELAAVGARPGLPDFVLRRVLNALFRLGRPADAAAVASIAGTPAVSETLRLEALQALGEWAAPGGRDRVLGLWRPLEPRSAMIAADALRPALGSIFSGPDRVRAAAAKLAAQFGLREVGPALFAQLQDPALEPQARAEALRALDVLQDPRLSEALEVALKADAAAVRAAGQRLLAQRDPGRGLPLLDMILQMGTQLERQSALATLGQLPPGPADALLDAWLTRLLNNDVPNELQLELLEAATARSSSGLREKLAKYESLRAPNDVVSQFREALSGGDAARGKAIFYENLRVSCSRCHKIRGQGGEVGPELTKVAAQKTREFLLTSLVDPNKEIAKGFETVIVQTSAGKLLTGILKADDGKTLQLMTPEGKLLQVPIDEIEERASGRSAMPDQLARQLTRSELRDLVEFLSQQKE